MTFMTGYQSMEGVPSTCNHWLLTELLRDEWGQTINWGDVRDGFIFWSHGERSWIAREGNGLQVGDVASSRNFTFNRA